MNNWLRWGLSIPYTEISHIVWCVMNSLEWEIKESYLLTYPWGNVWIHIFSPASTMD